MTRRHAVQRALGAVTAAGLLLSGCGDQGTLLTQSGTTMGTDDADAVGADAFVFNAQARGGVCDPIDFDNLPVAYNDPINIDARANMMSAAAMGATAFQKGLGAIQGPSRTGRIGRILWLLVFGSDRRDAHSGPAVHARADAGSGV